MARVLFDGADAGGLGLWVTDGTAAGPRELTGITGANAAGLLGHASEFGFEGLNPGFAVFNHEVLFQGRDADGLLGLWVTNGTAGGTHELTGIAGANPSLGLKPNGFTVLNDEVLFNGTDAAGRAGLWVTDGTAAGTHELTGITGASTSFVGLDPFGSTVFDSEVLFRGTDAAGLSGLWVTDGTAAGTHQLTGIAGADPLFGLSPAFLTPFHGEVLFSGEDTTNQIGLWVTDGTAAGTHELTGIADANPTFELQPSYFTVFNDEVLFRGLDAGGQRGLWVTDGTAAGTHELTGIADASTSGLLTSSSAPSFTVFNNEMLFVGTNTAGQLGLWVTDGTAAGTHELSGIAGASTHGVMASGAFGNPFTVFGNEVLFRGRDAADLSGLWVTDGTAAGTHEITGISTANTSLGLNPQYLTPLPPSTVTDDFTGDGTSDILLQNTNGTPQIWLMNGASVASMTPLLNPGSAWQLAAAGDFNVDGSADLLWQNNDGLPAIWEMNGTAIIGGGLLPNPGPSWHIIAASDFNGDGPADILFQNTDGAAAVWEMNGTSIVGGNVLSASPDPTWHVIGAGDVNGDGKADILRQNTDGAPAVWEMNGTSIIAGGVLLNPGSSWHAIGLGDLTAT